MIGAPLNNGRYNLELWIVPAPIRSGLTTVLEQHKDVKAILMGTRRSDPYAASLQPFQVLMILFLPLFLLLLLLFLLLAPPPLSHFSVVFFI